MKIKLIHITSTIFVLVSLILFTAQATSQKTPQSNGSIQTSIIANGVADSVTIFNNTSILFTLDFDAATFSGREADWWLIHIGPEGTVKSLDLKSMTFKTGTTPSLQKELTSFQSLSLPPLSFTNKGTHSIYFGIDLNKNGNIDLSSAVYDKIKVNIIIPTVYNQAYQENFEKDKIEDIVLHAKNSYVLVDPFLSGVVEKIPTIKQNNNEIGCYISIGTGEDWRADFTQLQPHLVKKQWKTWAGEYFVNQTTTGIVAIMEARIDKMAQWQCDWVEFDNMDWAFDDSTREQYTFQLSKIEAIIYYQELCRYVHQQGMKCMAKNTVLNADNFDGVLYESHYAKKNWWDIQGLWSFLNVKKQVIINHYNEPECNKAYQDYKKLYNDNISFICENTKLKKYVHY